MSKKNNVVYDVRNDLMQQTEEDYSKKEKESNRWFCSGKFGEKVGLAMFSTLCFVSGEIVADMSYRNFSHNILFHDAIIAGFVGVGVWYGKKNYDRGMSTLNTLHKKDIENLKNIREEAIREMESLKYARHLNTSETELPAVTLPKRYLKEAKVAR